MTRFRIRDLRRHRTLFESFDLAAVDAYWDRRHRRQDDWVIQWKDAEAEHAARVAGRPSFAWEEPPPRALPRLRASRRAGAPGAAGTTGRQAEPPASRQRPSERARGAR